MLYTEMCCENANSCENGEGVKNTHSLEAVESIRKLIRNVDRIGKVTRAVTFLVRIGISKRA